MSKTPVPGPVIFAIVLIAAVALLLAGRPLLRLLLRPVRWLLGGFATVFRVLRRVLRRAFGLARRGVAAEQVEITSVPYKALVHVIDMTSLAEQELGEIPQPVRKMVERQGIFFRSANANRAVDTLQGSLSLDDAKRNLESARKYYEKPMDEKVSPGILYEDSEEALIIGILKDVDLTFFYVMRRINRNVSRNVLKVIAVMTGIVVTFPFFAGSIDLRVADPQKFNFNALLYAVVCGGFIGALALCRLFYSNAARNNGQHFNYFVQTYFGRLLSQHKSAAAAFSSVLNDRTSELETVEQNANIWFLNLHWLSARQWFLELYVRNVIFQIGRNLLWYYLTVPVFFLIVLPVLYFGLPAAAYAVAAAVAPLVGASVNPGDMPRHWGPDWSLPQVFIPGLVLLAGYAWSLTGLLTKFWYEVTTQGWLGFKNMDVNGVIARNIGPVVREVVDRRRNPYGQRRP